MQIARSFLSHSLSLCHSLSVAPLSVLVQKIERMQHTYVLCAAVLVCTTQHPVTLRETENDIILLSPPLAPLQNTGASASSLCATRLWDSV